LNNNNQLNTGLPTSSDSLSDSNKASNKALLKVYGIGFGLVILLILVLLIFRDDGDIVVSAGIVQNSVVQNDPEILDQLVDNASASIAQQDALDLQIQQRNSEILNLQDQLQELSRLVEEEQSLLIENNSNGNNAASLGNVAQISEQLLSLTAALSGSNAKILQLEEDLRKATGNASSMQEAINELTNISELAEEQMSSQFSQFEATIAERDVLIQELETELELLQKSLVVETPEQPTIEDMLPLVAIAPQYPTRAAQRGIEGWCIVAFTVDGVGNVVKDSITVVDAEPGGMFDRSSIRAAALFKFQPRVVDGRGVSVDDVQYVFRYQLVDN
jgi:TonB family protein